VCVWGGCPRPTPCFSRAALGFDGVFAQRCALCSCAPPGGGVASSQQHPKPHNKAHAKAPTERPRRSTGAPAAAGGALTSFALRFGARSSSTSRGRQGGRLRSPGNLSPDAECPSGPSPAPGGAPRQRYGSAKTNDLDQGARAPRRRGERGKTQMPRRSLSNAPTRPPRARVNRLGPIRAHSSCSAAPGAPFWPFLKRMGSRANRISEGSGTRCSIPAEAVEYQVGPGGKEPASRMS
jgi:hypothetical protein